MKRNIWAAVAACAVAFLAFPANAFVILAPGSTIAGKSIADWTADWFTWAWQAPVTSSPLLDTTGEFANENNNGPVFFIAGTAGGNAVRSFDVPGGRPILIPMINLFDTLDPPALTDAIINDFLAHVTDAFAIIDGVSVANPFSFLEVTDFFSMGPVRADGLLGTLFPSIVGVDAFPTKGAGYWLMVDGLAAGPHTFTFGGSCSSSLSCGEGFSTTVSDSISVVSEPALLGLLVAGLVGFGVIRRRGDTRVRSLGAKER